MKLKDLGEIDTGIVLFGGPYSNLQATEAMLDVIRQRGFSSICTGDCVAYCADPAATVAALRSAGVHVVAGNCDKQLAVGAMTCGCGFEAGSTCDVLSSGWFAHAHAHIGATDRAWMAGLPDMSVFSQAGQRFAVVHGGATDVSRFLWPTSPDMDFKEEIECIQMHVGPGNGGIAGHCGIGFMRSIGDVTWINAGVIGMPPHDGGRAARYAVMSDDGVRIARLDYDAAGAATRMVAVGLTQGYHDSLLSGYWPSEDVLPPALRRSAPVSASTSARG